MGKLFRIRHSLFRTHSCPPVCPGQVAGSFLSFHSESYLDANTMQLITDSYDISGLFFPPPAPYSGSPSGFGPVIPDAPSSRTIEDIAVPEPTSFSMLTVAALILIGRVCIERKKSPPNKSLQATRDGAGSSAVAVHVIRSRVPELWR